MDDVWNKGNLALLEEIIHPDHVMHNPSVPPLGTGPEAYANLVKLYRGALDTHFTLEDQIAEGDRVANRWTVRGRYDVQITGITIHRISDGMIMESWGNWDAEGLMQQLKAVRPSR